MKERPILFSAPMVRAILEDRKTVTRRIVKPQPPVRNDIINAAYCGHPNLWLPNGNISSATPREWKCPYGQPGDHLWVRETHFNATKLNEGHVLYRADGVNSRFGWTPSIHMPRWASRITLEVTGVRVERLQAISEHDALAEGIDVEICRASIGKAPLKGGYMPICAFSYLWDQLNGPGSWDANSWVWVVEFKRLLEADVPC